MDVGAIAAGCRMLTGMADYVGTQEEKAPAPAASSDKVSLSRGELFKSLRESFLDGAAKDGAITVDELRSFRAKKIEQAGKMLTDTLTRLGIPGSASFGISVAPDNSVTASGSLNAADRNRLQDALSADKSFVQAYNAASGTSSVIDAAGTSADFSAMYAENAKEAVAKYSWLFGKEWNHELTFSDGAVGMKTL